MGPYLCLSVSTNLFLGGNLSLMRKVSTKVITFHIVYVSAVIYLERTLPTEGRSEKYE